MIAMTIGIVPVAVLSALAAAFRCDNDVDIAPHKIGGQLRKPFDWSCLISINRDGPPLDIADVTQPFEQRLGAKRK